MKILFFTFIAFLMMGLPTSAKHSGEKVEINFEEPLEWKENNWADADLLFSEPMDGDQVISVGRNKHRDTLTGESQKNRPEGEKAKSEPRIAFDDEQSKQYVSSAKLGDTESLLTSELDGSDRVTKMWTGPQVGEGDFVSNPSFTDNSTGQTRPLTQKDLENISKGVSSGSINPPGKAVGQSSPGPGG